MWRSPDEREIMSLRCTLVAIGPFVPNESRHKVFCLWLPVFLLIHFFMTKFFSLQINYNLVTKFSRICLFHCCFRVILSLKNLYRNKPCFVCSVDMFQLKYKSDLNLNCSQFFSLLVDPVMRLSTDRSTLWVHGIGKNLALTSLILVSKLSHIWELLKSTLVDHIWNHFHTVNYVLLPKNVKNPFFLV